MKVNNYTIMKGDPKKYGKRSGWDVLRADGKKVHNERLRADAKAYALNPNVAVEDEYLRIKAEFEVIIGGPL
jgi:hypothetical protein